MSEPVVRTVNLGKEYPLPEGRLRVFGGLNMELLPGDVAAIMGMSGVGKTTLLNLLGALDRPSEGTVYLDGEDLYAKDIRSLAKVRNRKIGFVFQFYHLLPEFTALENVMLPPLIAGMSRKESVQRAGEALEAMGLSDRASHRPAMLSGGEQQRVAIARAIAKNPAVLLCDEPTGALDYATGKVVLDVIARINHELGTTVIVITHNASIAGMADRVLRLADGRIGGVDVNARRLTAAEIAW